MWLSTNYYQSGQPLVLETHETNRPRVQASAFPPPFTWGDGVVLLGVGVLIYLGVKLAMGAPELIKGPEISLSPVRGCELAVILVVSTIRLASQQRSSLSLPDS